MFFEIEEQGNCHIVTLHGQLGALYVNQNRQQLVELAKQRGRVVLLDLEDVDFIDSSGLGLVVALVKHSRENGGDLLLCNLQVQSQSLFDLTKLNKVLGIYPSRDEALASIAKS